MRQAFAGFAGGNLRVDNRLVVKGPSPAMTPPASPGVPSTVPQASAPPGTCEIAMKAKLNFFTNSAVLTVSDKAKLKAMLACMKEGKYEVGGHTDNVGPDLRNQQLSEARAKVAMAYLVKRGVSAEFISATGYGMTKPLTGNDTIEGRRENRRVEVVRQ